MNNLFKEINRREKPPHVSGGIFWSLGLAQAEFSLLCCHGIIVIGFTL